MHAEPLRGDDYINVINPGKKNMMSMATRNVTRGTDVTFVWKVPNNQLNNTLSSGYLSVDGGWTWERVFKDFKNITRYTWRADIEDTEDAVFLVELRGTGASESISMLPLRVFSSRSCSAVASR